MERLTTRCLCHGIVRDKSIFSLNLPRNEIPHGSPSTNHDQRVVNLWLDSLLQRKHVSSSSLRLFPGIR